MPCALPKRRWIIRTRNLTKPLFALRFPARFCSLPHSRAKPSPPGLSAPTLIVVADLNRLQVDAYVDETDIAKVHLGQEADITVDAFPKRPFRGKVTKVASGSTIQNGVITYDVTLSH